MRILLWNVADLPFFVNPAYGNVEDKMKKIILLMQQYNVDLACLQEAFNKGWRKHYLFGTYARDTFPKTMMNSGLMMLHMTQRHPYRISRLGSAYYRFRCTMGEDTLCCKGAMVSRRRWDLWNVLIVNTHLQADPVFGFGNPVIVRRQQMAELAVYVYTIVQPTDHIIVVCGDFNHHIYRHQSIRLAHGWLQLRTLKVHKLQQTIGNHEECIFQGLDHAYAIVRTTASAKLRSVQLIVSTLPLQQCSDHNPVIVSLRIKK
jgi:hypothetical protein